MTLQTVDPRNIILAMPCKDGRNDVLATVGLCNVIGSGRLANQPLCQYGGSNVGAVRNLIAHEFMTRTQADWLMMLDDDIGFRLTDWDLLWEDQAGELAVCSDYLQKLDGQKVAARFGLGFARVHRRVFEMLTELTTHDGQPFVRQGIYAGTVIWDYFPQGVNSAGEYRQEDHGFWALVHAAQVSVRIERRTHLKHSGRSTWTFDADELDQESMLLGAQ
jgi:hypothetical protein